MQDNLKKRIITALIVYPLIVFCILYSNELVIRMILNIIIFLSAFEVSKMCFYNNPHEDNNRKHYFFIALVFLSILLSMSIVSLFLSRFAHCFFTIDFLPLSFLHRFVYFVIFVIFAIVFII